MNGAGRPGGRLLRAAHLPPSRGRSGAVTRHSGPRALALVALATAGCATAPAAPPPLAPLAERIEAVTAEPPFDGVHWGILLVDPASGRLLYERNANLRFVPASNMKIPVTHAALALLGPDWRFRTTLTAMAGPDPDGVIAGSLLLTPQGDPSLGPPWYPRDGAALDSLSAGLRAAGVRAVRGDLVVDVSRWDSTTVPSSWMVGNLATRSGATGGAFAIDAGELRIEVTGGTTPGDSASVRWTPFGRGTFVENRVLTGTVSEGVRIVTSYQPEARRWIVEGRLPPAASEVVVRAQRDPVRVAADALLASLVGAGIAVDGELRILWTPDEARQVIPEEGTPDWAARVELASLESPPMAEIARAILEPSQNWMTEQVVRALGAELGGRGSWSAGFRVMSEFFEEELGIDPADLHFRDGSGLSAYNLLSPRALVRMLDDARGRPWAEAYRDAMAEPGRSGTTLSGRLGGLEGRVFAKTGTISHVNSLSGYLVRDDGRELTFAILTNAANLPAAEVRGAIDRVLRAMAEGG